MPIVGVIYSVAQGRVRRMVIPDSDAELADMSSWVLPGEAALTYDRRLGRDEATAQAQVNAVTGRINPDDDVCAIMRGGVAVAVVRGDPTIDALSDGAVIPAYDGVVIGCTFDGATELFTRPQSRIPAGTRLKDGSILQQDITVPSEILVRPVRGG